ncbi:MAG: T9SS type A sorting domain-containing protein, partial [Bacteroidota bacterium]
FSYSPVRKLDPFYSTLNLEVQPSLTAGGDVLIQIRHDREEPLLLEIFDAAGRQILRQDISGIRGNTETRFDTSRLSAGHYTVQVSNTDASSRNTVSFVRR